MTLKRWGLHGLPRTGYEAVNGHSLPGHHIFVGKRINGLQVGYKLFGFHYRSPRFNRVLGVNGFLNRDFVDGFVGQFSEMLGHALRRLILQWG